MSEVTGTDGGADARPSYSGPPQVTEREALDAVVAGFSDLPRLAAVLDGAHDEAEAVRRISVEYGLRPEQADVVLDQRIRFGITSKLDPVRRRLAEIATEEQ